MENCLVGGLNKVGFLMVVMTVLMHGLGLLERIETEMESSNLMK
ncbi:MAG: hypothetical protein KatS3mg016_1570 [Fimbriimonadales bacterium]|nr:MAG: hypothetical protein KatS3mg016_1570 [Fimbriimonadales bacterium]